MIAHTYNTSVDAAFDMIRGYARNNRLSLGEVASQIVNRTLSI
ncbi:ANTAR domain-containing protein [Leifsonia sp. A12D58]